MIFQRTRNILQRSHYTSSCRWFSLRKSNFYEAEDALLGSQNFIYDAKAFRISKNIDFDFVEDTFTSDTFSVISKPENGQSILCQLNSNSFIHLSSFGSVVLFNTEKSEVDNILKSLEQYNPSGFIPESRRLEDNYEIEIKSDLKSNSILTPYKLYIKSLNSKYLTLIGSLLSKSAALADAESILNLTFDTIHNKKLSFDERIKLRKKVDGLVFECLHSLKILDRTSVKSNAWKEAKYYEIWEGLRSDLEIEERWETFYEKATFLSHEYVQSEIEIRTSENSERSEKLIIALIGFEVLIAVVHLYLEYGHT